MFEAPAVVEVTCPKVREPQEADGLRGCAVVATVVGRRLGALRHMNPVFH